MKAVKIILRSLNAIKFLLVSFVLILSLCVNLVLFLGGSLFSCIPPCRLLWRVGVYVYLLSHRCCLLGGELIPELVAPTIERID